MKDRSAVLLLSAALALTPAISAAEDTNPGELSARIDDAVARIKALSEDELKQFYRQCSRASVRGHLGAGEIALCSIGYEQLLQRHFGGDFRALLAWRRTPEGERERSRPSPF